MSGLLLARRMGGAKTAIVLPAIGDAWLGGYYFGIIDTTKSNIIAADDFQSGKRRALIVAPKTLESSSKSWKTAASAGPTGVRTRWNGQGATAAMVAAGGATYPAASYCDGLSYPSDGGSPWYLGAFDEMQLLYRMLKGTNETNGVSTFSVTFPGSQAFGVNPSSDPTFSAQTSTVPGQTSVAAFRGGAETLGASGANRTYWSSTEASDTTAMYQMFSGSGGNAGWQGSSTKTNTQYVRPIRSIDL